MSRVPAFRSGWFRGSTFGVLIALMGLACASAVIGQDEAKPDPLSKWDSQKVVQKSPDFSVRKDPAANAKRARWIYVYTVTDVDGDRLYLEAEVAGHGLNGWVKADQVLLIHQAIAFFSDRIDADPKDAFAWIMRAVALKNRGPIPPSSFEELLLRPPIPEQKELDLDELEDPLAEMSREKAPPVPPGTRLGTPTSAPSESKEPRKVRPDPFDSPPPDLFDAPAPVRFVDNLKQALADIDEAIRLDPKNPAAHYWRGVILTESEKYDDAIAAIEEAIRLGTGDPVACRDALFDVYESRAETHVIAAEIDEAIADFNEAIRRHPRRAMSVRARVANLHAQRGSKRLDYGKIDEALADLDEAIRLGLRTAEVYYNRGRARARKKQYNQAIADFTEAIRLETTDPRPYQERGEAREASGDHDGAISDFNEAIRLDPIEAAEAYSGRGAAWYNKQEPDRAIADYNQAIALDPDSYITHKLRAFAWGAQGRLDLAIKDNTEVIRIFPVASSYRQRGLVRYFNKDYDEAIADFTEAIRRDPEDAEDYVNRGNVWASKKVHDKAVADFTEAIRIDPGRAYAYARRGDQYPGANDDLALADYEKAIALDPSLATAYRGRGFISERRQQDDKALADYERSLSLDPDDALSHFNRGRIRAKRGDSDGAIRDFSRAIELYSDDADYYVHRAAALDRKGELDAAIVDCNQAIRLEPRNAVAYSMRGWARRRKKEFEAALADYDQAIRFEPEEAWYYVGRGLVYEDMTEYARAIAEFDRAIRMNPRMAVSHGNRARVLYWKFSDETGAMADLNEAIRLDSGKGWLFQNRGLIHRIHGEWAEALADLDEAIRLKPRDALAHYERAVERFATRQAGVVDDVEAVLDIQGWRGDKSRYAILWGYFAALRDGQPERARRLLDQASKRCDTSDWPYPIIKHLRGELDEPGLLAAADSDSDRGEARCYLGLEALQSGRTDAAIDHFQQMRTCGNPRSPQYAIGIAELNRLLAKDAEGDGPYLDR